MSPSEVTPRHHAAIEIVTGALGLALFVSPWLVGFTDDAAASWNAWIVGVLLVAAAVATAVRAWPEWPQLVLGIWVILVPWLIGTQLDVYDTSILMIIGAVVAVLAVVALTLDSRRRRRGLR